MELRMIILLIICLCPPIVYFGRLVTKRGREKWRREIEIDMSRDDSNEWYELNKTKEQKQRDKNNNKAFIAGMILFVITGLFARDDRVDTWLLFIGSPIFALSILIFYTISHNFGHIEKTIRIKRYKKNLEIGKIVIVGLIPLLIFSIFSINGSIDNLYFLLGFIASTFCIIILYFFSYKAGHLEKIIKMKSNLGEEDRKYIDFLIEVGRPATLKEFYENFPEKSPSTIRKRLSSLHQKNRVYKTSRGQYEINPYYNNFINN